MWRWRHRRHASNARIWPLITAIGHGLSAGWMRLPANSTHAIVYARYMHGIGHTHSLTSEFGLKVIDGAACIIRRNQSAAIRDSPFAAKVKHYKMINNNYS